MAVPGMAAVPIQLATRLVLDVISYTNPLPPWSDPITIDYLDREERIERRIREYLKGARPKLAFEILVPRKDGTKKKWFIPSVNDQIVLQAAVSAVAERIDRLVDRDRVLSYRYNTDPNRLQLTNSQISSWSLFQAETQRRLRRRPYLLQFDLEQAFGSLKRAEFKAFLGKSEDDPVAVKLVGIILDSIGPRDEGVPLVNDSVFYLGNAYLSVVDRVVGKYSTDFIRFVDDYRVFNQSRDGLEAIFQKVSAELALLGFRISERKVKLGSGEEYLEAISRGKYASTETQDGYISAAVFEDVIEPSQMVELVARSVEHPQDYMTEGFGRLTLGAIRRMRVNADAAARRNYPKSPRDKFVELMSGESRLVMRVIELLRTYAPNEEEVWRTVWLLYVAEDLRQGRLANNGLAVRLDETVRTIRESPRVPTVARLWARRAWSDWREVGRSSIEELHDAGYLEEGLRRYGGRGSA